MVVGIRHLNLEHKVCDEARTLFTLIFSHSLSVHMVIFGYALACNRLLSMAFATVLGLARHMMTPRESTNIEDTIKVLFFRPICNVANSSA